MFDLTPRQGLVFTALMVAAGRDDGATADSTEAGLDRPNEFPRR